MQRFPSRAAGFTLIELVITVAILGILASAALPLAELTVKRTKEMELRDALRQIRGALDAYKKAADEGRVAKQPTDSGYPPRLQALVDGVPELRSTDNEKIYFLRRLPRDPFAADAGADTPAAATWGERSYQSAPNAPQRGDDVFDVYSLSDATGLNGVPYREW